jgi:hypothetical protein
MRRTVRLWKPGSRVVPTSGRPDSLCQVQCRCFPHSCSLINISSRGNTDRGAEGEQQAALSLHQDLSSPSNPFEWICRIRYWTDATQILLNKHEDPRGGVFGGCQRWNVLSWPLTWPKLNYLVAEPAGLTLLLRKHAIAHDSVPIPSASHLVHPKCFLTKILYAFLVSIMPITYPVKGQVEVTPKDWSVLPLFTRRQKKIQLPKRSNFIKIQTMDNVQKTLLHMIWNEFNQPTNLVTESIGLRC